MSRIRRLTKKDIVSKMEARHRNKMKEVNEHWERELDTRENKVNEHHEMFHKRERRGVVFWFVGFCIMALVAVFWFVMYLS
jgi:hypothetical protein